MIPSDEQYTATFDRFEFLIGMILADLDAKRADGMFVPSPFIGSYGWRYKHNRSRGPQDRFKTGRLPASSNDTNPSLIALIELRDRGENP